MVSMRVLFFKSSLGSGPVRILYYISIHLSADNELICLRPGCIASSVLKSSKDTLSIISIGWSGVAGLLGMSSTSQPFVALHHRLIPLASSLGLPVGLSTWLDAEENSEHRL